MSNSNNNIANKKSGNELEMDQYMQIMKRIEDFAMNDLEKMKYGLSPYEKQFKTYCTAGLVLLFILFIVHSIFKFLRFRNTEWLPNVSSILNKRFAQVPRVDFI